MREVSTYAKWVLAGEHTVLRGAPAIVLPHQEYGLTFRALHRPQQSWSGEFHDLLGSALDLLKPGRRGEASEHELLFQGNVPVGAGLGSSAALCVAMTRLAAQILDLNPSKEQQLEVARRLEDRFHGESSGMDVAAGIWGEPIRFERGSLPKLIELHPRWAESSKIFGFFDTGKALSTREAVTRVQARNTSALDEQMLQAVSSAQKGLEQGDADAIAHSMALSMDCYRQWGLLDPAIQAQADSLLAQGARSVRLTGAGGGGFLVAFWPDRR